MAVGLTKSANVEKGPFTNAMMVLGGSTFDGAGYIACDGDGKPVSLTLRFSLADLSGDQVAALHKNAPIRDGDAKLWRWGDGTTQPVGRKGSRWTVGGPRITTASRGRTVQQPTTIGADLMGGDMMAAVKAVMPIAARGKLNKAQQGVCDQHNLTAATLRGLAVSIA